jgi:hypothetical protein
VKQNEFRVARGRAAAAAHVTAMYGKHSRIDWDLDYQDDCMDEILIDLFTDCCHLAQSRGLDVDRIVREAYDNFVIEKEEGYGSDENS